MTEEEVRGVVEEFLGSGLPEIPDEELLKRRGIQQRWYLDTLVDGFALTGKQKVIAKMKLRETLLEDHAAYEKARRSGEEIRVYQTAADPFLSVVDPSLHAAGMAEIQSATRMLDISLWLGMGKLAPWNLCELDDDQRAISWFESESKENDGRPIRIRTKDAGTDECYKDLDDPFAENPPIFISAAGAIFPLSMGQVDRIRAATKIHSVSNGSGVKRPGLIDEVKCLTSPQLRTLLLFEPGMAGKLLKELGE